MGYFFSLVLCLAPLAAIPAPCKKQQYAYATVMLRIPYGMDGREIVRMIDNMPFEGVYVIDAQDLPGPPKNPHRPGYLPKIPNNGSR